MMKESPHPVLRSISEHRSELTPKGRVLADYILENPKKAVFMTTRELADASGVSEATVVRFVGRIGYGGYGRFLQALRDAMDTDMTLLDRMPAAGMGGPAGDRFHRVVAQEMDNLRQLYEHMDMDALERVVSLVEASPTVYVIGSRLSYTMAYYMGWALIKLRGDVRILKGSDSTTLDRLTIAPPDALVVVIATSRYPNELIRICRHARRQDLTLAVLTDSAASPLIPFANAHLVAPSRHIPYVGCPTSLSCLINYMIQELASRRGSALAEHQGKLERMYRENDILFNIERG